MARKTKKRNPVDLAEVFSPEVVQAFKEQVRALFEQLEREGYFDERGQVIPFTKGRGKKA